MWVSAGSLGLSEPLWVSVGLMGLLGPIWIFGGLCGSVWARGGLWGSLWASGGSVMMCRPGSSLLASQGLCVQGYVSVTL